MAAFIAVAQILAGYVPPAYAFAFPVGDLFIVNLGDLPPWLGVLLTFGIWLDNRNMKKTAAIQVATSQSNSKALSTVGTKIDGMLVDRDVATKTEAKHELLAEQQMARNVVRADAVADAVAEIKVRDAGARQTEE